VDSTTHRLLHKINVSSGWTCLEVGPGTGSIARWLADRVAPAGHVAVTDVNPRSLDWFDFGDSPAGRYQSVRIDDMGVNRYALIHSRLILSWCERPVHMLQRMVKALRPGGWIVLEHPEGRPATMDSSTPRGVEFNRVSRLIHAACASYGVDLSFGRRLPWLAADLGLTDIAGEVTQRIVRGGPLPSMSSWMMQRWRDGLVASGLLTQGDLDAQLAVFRDPRALILDDSFLSFLGRKPL
jgi:SAM-dependent methyltransferase